MFGCFDVAYLKQTLLTSKSTRKRNIKLLFLVARKGLVHWQIARSLATSCWDANSNGRHKNEMLNSVWIQPAATWFWDSAKVTIAEWKMITVQRQRMSYTRQRTLWFSVIPVWRLPFPVKPEVVAIWEIPSKSAWKKHCPRRQRLFTIA